MQTFAMHCKMTGVMCSNKFKKLAVFLCLFLLNHDHIPIKKQKNNNKRFTYLMCFFFYLSYRNITGSP